MPKRVQFIHFSFSDFISDWEQQKYQDDILFKTLLPYIDTAFIISAAYLLEKIWLGSHHCRTQEELQGLMNKQRTRALTNPVDQKSGLVLTKKHINTIPSECSFIYLTFSFSFLFG